MIDLEDVIQARETVKESVKKTPLVHSEFLSKICNGKVYLKLENLQISNSFKVRGAVNKTLHLSREERKRGIITASSGNHAIAVGIAAQKLNLPAKIVVPKSTPKKKIDKIKKYDVELILYGDLYDQAEQKALELAEKEGLTYVSSYNDEFIIAGQGTIGLEILEDLPDVDAIIVPIGGGGLISGIGIAAKDSKPSVKIFGVQSEASPVMYESLKAGRIVNLDEVKISESVAEGLFGGVIKGAITFKIIQKYVSEILLVKEESIRKSIYILWEKEKQIVEGAGATSVAAILDHKNRFMDKEIAAVISGGNIDDELLQTIIGEYKSMSFEDTLLS